MLKLIIIGTLGVGLAACSGDSGPSKEIVIGAVVDQTGSEAESSWVQAAQLAVDQVNSALQAEGHNEFQFLLRIQDSENIPAKGVARALDLVNNQRAQALIIDTSQVTEAVLSTFYDDDATNDLGVPIQCSSCTSGNLLNYTYNNPAAGGAVDPNATPVLTQVRQNTGGWLSRTTMTTVPMAFVAGYVLNGQPGGLDRNHDGVVRLSVLGSNEAFGQAGTNAIRANMPIVTGRTIAMDNTGSLEIERILHPNTTAFASVDFNPIIDRLLDSTVDCESCAAVGGVTPTSFNDTAHPVDYIIMISFQQFAASFVETYRLSGKAADGPPVLHYHTFRQSSSLYRLGALADGQIGISHALVSDNDAGQTYASDFRNDYGFDPNFWDSAYYDNAMTFMLATLIAQHETRTVDVTPSLVRDRIQCTSQPATLTYAPPATYTGPMPWTMCPSGASAQRVTPGLVSLRAGVRAIFAGTPIDYDGASGPVDYDYQKNVRDKVEFYKVDGNKYVTESTYNCLNFADNKCGVTTPIPLQ